MFNKRFIDVIKRHISGMIWLLRVLLVVLYILLVNGRGWVALFFLCLIPVDIAIKRKPYIVLEGVLAIFAILNLFPWFPLRQTVNVVHFYLLQGSYEDAAERYMDLSEYDMISIIDYNGQALGKKQAVVSTSNGVTRYRIKEENSFLYAAVYVEEKDDMKTVFFMIDGKDMSGFLYMNKESARKLPGIEKPYGESEKSGYCTPEFAEPEAGGFEPCKYQWMNELWLYYIESIS